MTEGAGLRISGNGPAEAAEDVFTDHGRHRTWRHTNVLIIQRVETDYISFVPAKRLLCP